MKIKRIFVFILVSIFLFCNGCNTNAAEKSIMNISCGNIIKATISKNKNELTFLFSVTKTGYYDFEFLNPIFKDKAVINGIDSYYYENKDPDVDEHPDFGEWNEQRQDCILTTYLKKGQKYYITVWIDKKAIKKETTVSFELRNHVHKYEILGCSNKTIDYYCEGCTKSKYGSVSTKLSKSTFIYNGKKQQQLSHYRQRAKV